jgi:hypothetical protein
MESLSAQGVFVPACLVQMIMSPLEKARALISEARSAEKSPMSEPLVTLVNIVFGVVVAQSLARYSDVIVHPELTLTTVGLGAVYLTVVSSWMGYHRLVSVREYAYKTGWAGASGFVSDLAIVLIYAYLLFSIAEIDTSDNLVRYIVGFPVLFLFYIISGVIRRLEYGPEASNQRLLWIVGAVLAATAVGYNALYSSDIGAREQLNWTFVGIPAAIILVWRFARRRLEIEAE